MLPQFCFFITVTGILPQGRRLLLSSGGRGLAVCALRDGGAGGGAPAAARRPVPLRRGSPSV